VLDVLAVHLLPARPAQVGGGEPLHRLGVGPDRLGGLGLGGQTQSERADLSLECPGVQLPGLPKRGSCTVMASALFLWRIIRSPAFPQARDLKASPRQGNDPRDRARGPRQASRRGAGYPAGQIPADGGQQTTLSGAPLRVHRNRRRAGSRLYAAAVFVNCAALHSTDRTFCRPPQARCAFSTFASLLAGLPHMPMSAYRRVSATSLSPCSPHGVAGG
jgi:hypothetical protein